MPEQSISFDPALLGQLACPVCRGDLRQDKAHLVCTGCSHAYPIVHGIPVLIAERGQSAVKLRPQS